MSAQSHRLSVAGVFITLGIIYGDIGTSPLYVLKSIVGTNKIEKELIYGGISCIIWTLTLITSFKYIALVLQADNKGEGGIFSLFALVQRKSKWLFWIAMFGAASMLCDGMITPPISVSSAIEGLAGVKGLEGIFIPGEKITIGVVVAILTLLFFFQRYGTKLVGFAFGPIMIVWFSMLAILGLNKMMDHPEVLAAIHPKYAIYLLTEYPKGFWLLGAVFLCTTGADALYSDMGHCGRVNIRATWGIVKVALIINYMGQAAWLMEQSELGTGYLEGRNPFFAIMPEWWLLPGIIIAAMATFIASQAMITGAFTLVSEAINLGFWPRVAVKYPTELKGQLYIPSVNWFLWAGCMFVLAVFHESEKMEAAYGFFINITMLMTTTLLGYYLKFKLKWPIAVVASLCLLFYAIELSFMASNIVKLYEAWMMVIIYVIVLHVMWITFMYRRLGNTFLQFVDLEKFVPILHALSNDKDVPKFATHIVYLTKANFAHQVEQKIVESILSKTPKRGDVYWFVHIDRTSEPYTREYEIEELENDLIIKVNIRLGFRIQPRVNNLFRYIVDDLVNKKEFDILAKPHPYTRYNANPDFKFVLLDKYISVDNELNLRESFITNAYVWMKHHSLSDIDAWGLEEADTHLEKVPLVVKPSQKVKLTRVLPSGVGADPNELEEENS
jgi:KUP system potassium uptake protein